MKGLNYFNSKLPAITVWLSVIIILSFSILWAFEKVLYVDNAYILFNMINEKGFQIAHHRYVMYFFQVLPYLGIKLGVGVEYLIYLYSINLYLVYLVWILICLYLLESTRAAIGICLSLFVGLANNFFITTEILHGICFCFLLMAYLKKYGSKMNNSRYYIVSFLIFLNVFGHPITLITTLFSLIYFMISEGIIQLRVTMKVLAIFLILVFVKKLFFTENSYEQGYLDELKSGGDLFINFFNLSSTRFFFDSVNLYLPFYVLFLLTLILLVFKKNYGMLVLFLISSLTYFIIACLIFNKADTSSMMERAFLPLIFFTVFVFVFEFWQPRLGFNLGVLALIIFGVNTVFTYAGFYTNRIKYISEVYKTIENSPRQKFYSYTNEIPYGQSIETWSMAIEILLYSTTKNKSLPKTVFFFDEPVPAKIKLHDPDLFLGVSFWRVWSIHKKLNPDYFPFSPQFYKYLNVKDLDQN